MKNTQTITLSIAEFINIAEIVMEQMTKHPNSNPTTTTIKMKKKTNGEIEFHINGNA